MLEQGIFLKKEIRFEVKYLASFFIYGIILVCGILIILGSIDLEEKLTPEQQSKSFKKKQSKLKSKEKELKGIENSLKKNVLRG